MNTVDNQEALKQELMGLFQDELEENLVILNKGLLALEKGPSEKDKINLIAELFRAAHSIKGGARAIDLACIESVAHHMEDILGAIKSGDLTLFPGLFDTFFASLDGVREMMDEMLKGQIPIEKREALIKSLESVLFDQTSDPELMVSGSQDISGTKQILLQNSYPGDKGPTGTNPLTSNQLLPGKSGGSPLEMKQEEETSNRVENGQFSISDTENPSEREKQPGKDSQPPDVSKIVDKPKAESIRVATEKLDNLMDYIGELMAAQLRIEQRLKDFTDIQHLVMQWQKHWRKMDIVSRQIRHKGEGNNWADIVLSKDLAWFLEAICEHAGEIKTLGKTLDDLLAQFGNDCTYQKLINDELQKGVRLVRMHPIAELFNTFPRMVRDLARDNGKQIRLEIEGSTTEVDRKILESMKDPLIHILRNAVNHGIEMPEERNAGGKPEEGVINLKATQKGSSIVLEIGDDGRGIDTKLIKEKAVSKGFISKAKAEILPDRETISLIFQSGLSTTKQVNDISGRGVGMDVVRSHLEDLQGMIHVDSQIGKGTEFKLTLPLTLASSHVLLVRASSEILALPTSAIERILKIDYSQIGNLDGNPAIELDGAPIPLISLAKTLNLVESESVISTTQKIPVVILGASNMRVAFQVNELCGNQEVVIKTLGNQLKQVRNVSGASILGNGDVVIILNPADMIKSALGTSRDFFVTEIEEASEQMKVLVVDDSITTRTLEKNILENAGFNVVEAIHGEEAISLFPHHRFDIVVSDIDMPVMDGFELTEKIKNDDLYKEIPIVLVTSLESPGDKIRGLNAGADAYIIKGSFDQTVLLETIDRLIG